MWHIKLFSTLYMLMSETLSHEFSNGSWFKYSLRYKTHEIFSFFIPTQQAKKVSHIFVFAPGAPRSRSWALVVNDILFCSEEATQVPVTL
jgi:hypothetical protein